MKVITEIIPRNKNSISKNQKPVIIKWNKIPFLRSQSVNACINEIYETSRDMGFLKINIIGASGSGKTVLSSVLGHQLHSLDPSFEVHNLKDEDLIDFKTTIKNLSKAKQCLIFDDLSGIVAKYGKSKLDILRAEITEIRHINDQENRKIIMILNFHAQKTLDKFLRISDFTFYTDCKNEEVGYLEELLGKSKRQTILKFKEKRAQSRMFHRFSFPLGKKDKFVYKDGDPFRILLYNNSLTTRFVVSPQLSWILGDKLCQCCNPTEKTKETKINLEQFTVDITRKFTKGIVKRAIQNKLLRQGIDTQPKRIQQCEKYIDRFFDVKNINLTELGEKFGLIERKTQLFPDKQPEFMEAIPI